MKETGQRRIGANAGWGLRGLFVFLLGLMAVVPQMKAQGTPVVTGFVGSTNVPQYNSGAGVQGPPLSIVVQGRNFVSGTTTATFGAYPASNVQVVNPTTMVVTIPGQFAGAAVGTTTTLAVCNGTNCASGGPAITLTVTATVPSMGTLTVSPTPVTTIQTTTASAQFTRSTTAGTTLPPPGVPSGTVTFASASGTIGTAPLKMDTTAVLLPTTTMTTVPTTPTPTFSVPGGTYSSTQTVTISDTNTAAAIYYTTDGSTPTTSSTLYQGAVVVAATETLNAIAIAAGQQASTVASAAYTIFVPIPTSLAFSRQPTNTATGVAFAPPVQVSILDQNSNVITNSTLAVSLALGTNPTQTTLQGTTTVNAVNGVATFSNVSIAAVGTGYTLRATSGNLMSATSTAFNIIPPGITVTPFSTLVGVASTLPGTFTLGVPAGANGAIVSLTSSVPANVTISPATVTVVPGATTGNFTFTGVAVGASNLTASATNYTTGTATVTATQSLVSLGTIPPVAPGQSVSLALSIGTAAPTGGLTISFTSSNPGVATVTATAFIPAGSRTPTANPQITGVVIGTTTITATAPGYAPDTRAVNVTVTAAFSPTSITIAHQMYSNITLNITAPAQTGGLMFTISSDAPATASVPASVTIPAGQTSVVVPLTGVADGSTTIRADSPGVTEATLSVTVSSVLSLYYGNQITGVNVYQQNYVYVPSVPATPVTVTATMTNPAIATVSTSATTVGTASASVPSVSSTSYNSLFFQGQSAGTTTVVLSAPGYTSATYTVTTNPSGFILTTGSISTTTFSAPTTVYLSPEILNPGTLTAYTTALLNPGLASISVPVNSSNTSVGTITTSPVIFAANAGQLSTSFQPTGAGTSTISLGTPAGFSTPANSNAVVATVTAPQLSFYYGNTTTGVNLQYGNLASVPVSPQVATTFTVTSSNPAVATVSTVATTVGTASVTYPGVTTSGNMPLYIDGVSVGTTTLTLSGAGYTNGTITVTVNPSGFTFGPQGNISTTSFSGPTQFYVYASILNPSTLTYAGTGALAPGVGPISVVVSSSNTATGTITTSPVVLNAGDITHLVSFQPAGVAGTSTLSVGAVSGGTGFSTASNATTLTATVTAPQLTIGYGNEITGVNIMVQDFGSVPVSPPVATTFTATSSNPSVATVSSMSTTVGTASITYPGVTAATSLPLYIQGQGTGTSTITLSGNGYTSATITVTVYPSGFTVSSGTISTTTFSSASTVYVYPSVLNPGTLTTYTNGTLNPGIAPVSVPVTSSNTTVGGITTSPVVFTGGMSNMSTAFQPASAGTSTVSLGTPTGGTGYSQPANNTSFTVTVTAPQLSLYNVLTGVSMQNTTGVGIPVNPPNAVIVTVVSNNPAIATISKSANVVGTATLSFSYTDYTTPIPTIYVQGQSVGSTTLTVSAPGYSNGNATVTVDPSGFTFGGSYNGGLSTMVANGVTSIPVYPSILNPGSLTYNTNAQLNPGLGGTNVVVTSSTPSTGTITLSPLVFNGGESYIYTGFQPLAAGSTNINIVQPAGFSTPTQYTGFTATVH